MAENTSKLKVTFLDGISIKDERKLLWDTVNNEVDGQIQDILQSFSK